MAPFIAIEALVVLARGPATSSLLATRHRLLNEYLLSINKCLPVHICDGLDSRFVLFEVNECEGVLEGDLAEFAVLLKRLLEVTLPRGSVQTRYVDLCESGLVLLGTGGAHPAVVLGLMGWRRGATARGILPSRGM